jgi:hypothetical protein
MDDTTAITRIQYWIYESRWPKGDFEPDPNMSRPALKRSRLSTGEDQSENTLPSDGSGQGSRTKQSAHYARTCYEVFLKLKGGYMSDSKAGISAGEGETLQRLLTDSQKAPSNTLFDDNRFSKTCARLRNRKEMRVAVDILRLITPSAENLADQGMPVLDCLRETMNVCWNKSIPVEGPRPQPDFFVGFDVTEFSELQIDKVNHKLRLGDLTYFSATFDMYFPFLTCEVKCGAQAILIADFQNAHSMTIAVRGVVELYRQVGRAKELHGKVLGFSISHDDRSVGIYAHYAEIDELKTNCYRHTLKEFHLAEDGGKNKWVAYQLTCNVYHSFVSTHLQRIKSAIDQLSDPFVRPSQPASSIGSAAQLQGTVARNGPSL